MCDFANVTSVNLDEYKGLSPENDQSYRYFMNHNLFDHININKENTNVPNGTAADLEAESTDSDAQTEDDLTVGSSGEEMTVGSSEE